MTAIALSHVRAWRIPAPLLAGVLILCGMLVAALVPGAIAPYDPIAFDYAALLQPPSLAHPFGTDNFGRDVLSRTIFATGVDLQIAFFATIAPLVVGTLVGLFIGFYGGLADAIFAQVVNLVMTFPFLVIVIAIVAVLGPGLENMYVAVSIVGWVFYARLTRAEVHVQRQSDYVAAARVLGYARSRILFRHILPNTLRPILVFWMTDMSLKILLGSSLGYLGLGAQPPTAEWGVLIADGKAYFPAGWWMAVFPGGVIVLCGIGFSLTGDGLADLLDVKR
ncbi:MAG: ABC transporter permease [Methylobacteriaceae bacterium]|nr:ABC transporter permease [Methylobacteriaceae bacterium]MBV9637011.1 ABC transporter permease [Methylobacteriaceae bacterium]MBV9705226.1 ABC transporter permease [Methylobacteriaceae bacterium]